MDSWPGGPTQRRLRNDAISVTLFCDLLILCEIVRRPRDFIRGRLSCELGFDEDLDPVSHCRGDVDQGVKGEPCDAPAK